MHAFVHIYMYGTLNVWRLFGVSDNSLSLRLFGSSARAYTIPYLKRLFHTYTHSHIYIYVCIASIWAIRNIRVTFIRRSRQQQRWLASNSSSNSSSNCALNIGKQFEFSVSSLNTYICFCCVRNNLQFKSYLFTLSITLIYIYITHRIYIGTYKQKVSLFDRIFFGQI